MSILIRSMEMPKTCWDCACSIYYESQDKAMCDITDETLDYILWKRERRPDCPLIELPPHGRLIDIKSVEYGKFTAVGNEYQRWWNGALDSIIDNAPTVIEAEGETDA